MHPLQEDAEIKRLIDSVQRHICVSVWNLKLLAVCQHVTDLLPSHIVIHTVHILGPPSL